MLSRRNFLLTSTLALTGLNLPRIDAEEQIPTLPYNSSALLACQNTILKFYQRQSINLKENGGYSYKEAESEYIQCLKALEKDLEKLGLPKLPKDLKEEEISAYLKLANQRLANHDLGLLYGLIKFGDEKYALNIRLYRGTATNLDQALQVFRNLKLKDYQPVPIFTVTKSLTPDVRKTDFWPIASDTHVYGQTITEETGKIDRILIFQEAISLRAKDHPNLATEMLTQTIVNELANAYFRQNVPTKFWDRMLTSQISVRQLSEAFSDYCSLQACSNELFLIEINRIIYSKNPNYLLTKALVAKPLQDFMIERNLKDLDVLNKELQNSDLKLFGQFKSMILASFAGNVWVNAVVNGKLTKEYILNQ